VLALILIVLELLPNRDANYHGLRVYIRYLGIYLVSASSFKCSLDNANRSFYRSFNATFGKVGRIASSEVIVQLTKSKCFPAIYYALEACPLRVSQFKSINYVINSTFKKIFDIKSQEVVNDCLEMFNYPPAEKTIAVRKCKLLTKFKLSSKNCVVHLQITLS